MTGFTRAWIGWVAAFAVIESAAITRSGRTGDDAGTMSAHLAHLFMVRTRVGRIVWAVTVASCAVVLWSHIHGFRNR